MEPLTPSSSSIAGRYVIRRELGRGGAAMVYLADDTQTGQVVALKMPRCELIDAVGRERFAREISIVARLRHPNILPILDSGEIDGSPFYTMPVVHGGTLATRLATQGALAFDPAIKIASEVAAALDFAHAYQVVHRDINPQNILFDGDRAVIVDFGIARNVTPEEAERLTESGLLLGTPAYMSPEQCGGDRRIDERSDVYSLGCVVYEMLAGEPPFTASTVKGVIAKHLSEPVPQLRVLRPMAADALQGVMEKALAKVPADRYRNATDFVRDLALAVPGPLPRAMTRRAPAIRHRTRWIVSAAVAAAVLLVAVRAISVSRVPRAAPGMLDPHRIAVLYFDDLSPGTVPEYLTDGMTENLIDQLSSVRALRVISPNGVRAFRKRSVRLDSVARALDVGTIVGGSVQRFGDTVRVVVRLIAAATGQQLYSQTLQQPWSNAFALQDSVTIQVAFLLRQRLGEVIALRTQASSTRSPAAWVAAQIASGLVRRSFEVNALRNQPAEAAALLLRADSLYVRASRLDGAWPLPWLRRGRITKALGGLPRSAVPPLPVAQADGPTAADAMGRQRAWTLLAVALADSALRRTPGSAEGMAVRGEALFQLASLAGAPDSLFGRAEASLQAAVSARPDYASAWTALANVFLRDGRFAEAAAAAQQAYDADEFFEVRDVVRTGFLSALYGGRFDDARSWCGRGLNQYPGDPRFAECRLTLLGWTGHGAPDVAAAWRALAAIELHDSSRTLGASWVYRRFMVGAVIARSGLRDSALRVIVGIHAAQRADSSVSKGRLEEAYVRLLLGDRPAALALLTEHLRLAPAARAHVARDPWYRVLHGDPRFDLLVRPSQ